MWVSRSDLERRACTHPPEIDTNPWFVANRDEARVGLQLPATPGQGSACSGNKKTAPLSLPFEIKPGSAREGLWASGKPQKSMTGGSSASTRVSSGQDSGGFRPAVRQGIKSRMTTLLAWSRYKLWVALAGRRLVHVPAAPYKGRVLRLYRSAKGLWVTEDLLDLGGAPEVASKDVDGSLVVATYNRLLRIFPTSKKTDVIVDNAFWGGLYPNSLVIAPSGTVFVGMRHGIAKVEKKGKSYKAFCAHPTQYDHR